MLSEKHGLIHSNANRLRNISTNNVKNNFSSMNKRSNFLLFCDKVIESNRNCYKWR